MAAYCLGGEEVSYLVAANMVVNDVSVGLLFVLV